MPQPVIKTRREKPANYSSVFFDGKTIRIPIDPSKPITELMYPEFYDVAINSRCMANCRNCYTSATKDGKNFQDVVRKINNIFGPMSPNERAYQVALGGAGEPTLHEDFIDVLEAFWKLGIVPNYTTNGMHLSQETLNATKMFCGGVAVSAHPHIKNIWKRAIDLLLENNIRTNIHIIVAGKDSIEYLKTIYNDYNDKVEYIVILPQINIGRASDITTSIDYDGLRTFLDCNSKNSNIALGANLYSFLMKEKNRWDVSLYPPEILSKYLILDDPIILHRSSFDLTTPVFRSWMPTNDI